MPIPSQSNCPHNKYTYPAPQNKVAATRPKSSKPPTPPTRSDIQHFPAPLVLPGDGLAIDPDMPQDSQKWLGVRNQVTSRRRTVYLAAPGVLEGMEMSSWSIPQRIDAGWEQVPKPKISDILEYTAAFYHGFPVKKLQFPEQGRPEYTEAMYTVRTRPCPDGIFSHQLNLEDLLTAAMAMLPSDAYALCLLVDHDLFESEDDELVCGRAYGGRRVAVVLKARYNPLLDDYHGIERKHAWPASHCQTFIEDNLIRTTTHELSHCFGLGHHTYYACLMQGSGSLSENLRQPPYFCPVDLAKVLSATKTSVEERYRALC
ncbi:hypothetical protein BDV19DRAFT_378325 [Aspergillus venezuelensis]